MIWLSLLELNPRSRAVRCDLGDCNGLHRTMMKLFPEVDQLSARNALGVLYRLERDREAKVRVLLQSLVQPDFARLPEKYLKALLTKRQLEFPKTHEIRRLLELLNESDHEVVEALPDAKWLDPFGVEIRYPSDRPETLPGDEKRALKLAERTRAAVSKALAL